MLKQDMDTCMCICAQALIIVLGMSWYLIVVLVCISLMISGSEHFFHAIIGPLYILYIFLPESLVFTSFLFGGFGCVAQAGP